MSLPINLNLIILWLSILIDRSHQLVYTHSLAKKLLTEAGIKFPEHECVFSNCTWRGIFPKYECVFANCTWRGIEFPEHECNVFCALLEGIHDEVIDGPNGIITLANQSGCTITIVGGTDAKDNDEPVDRCTNSNGWGLNFLNNYCINRYIEQSFRFKGDDTWIARSGNIYKRWTMWPDYWEVQYKDACYHSSPSDNRYYDYEEPSANNVQSKSKLCKNSGGSCRPSTRLNKKWCNFYDGMCEEDEEQKYKIKCCVPKNSNSCVLKGGNCIFGHSCNLSSSLVIPNICDNTPYGVICCVPNERSRTQVIATLTEQKSTSNLFVNSVNLLFLLLLLLLIVILIHKWYIKKKDNFAISSKWTDIENLTGDDDDETKMSLIPGRFYPENVTIAEHFIFQNSRIEIFDARGNFGNDSVIVKKKNEKATKGHQHQKNYHNSFATEAAIHINLDHDNIVKCFGCYAQNGRIIGIFMEKMECNLSELFDKEKKSMTNAHMKALEKNPIDICIQLTEALVYLQSKRIVHADIADRNCLLKFGDNGKLLAKLSDFSLSKSLEEGQKRASVGSIPQRWSPREIQKESGHFLVSFESDIWSLGATLIELFTHERPYNLWKEFEIREEQRKNETTPLDYLEKMCMEKWQKIPPKARSILEKCFITIEPSERITSERINATDLLNEWKNYGNE